MSAESEAASRAARRTRRGTQATVQANRRASVANRAPGVSRGQAINQFNANASGNTGNLFGRGSRANRLALRARNAISNAATTVRNAAVAGGRFLAAPRNVQGAANVNLPRGRGATLPTRAGALPPGRAPRLPGRR